MPLNIKKDKQSFYQTLQE